MRPRVAALVLTTLAGCAQREATSVVAGPPRSSTPAYEAPAPQVQSSRPTPPIPAPTPPPTPTPPPSPTPTAPALSNIPEPPPIDNRDGLRGLLKALSDVDRVLLRRWDQPAPDEPLSLADTRHLVQLIGAGGLTPYSTVTHPPWPAALVFYTRRHGTYAVTLVGSSNLRLDAGRAGGIFEGAAARWNDGPLPEIAIDRDDDFLWSYFEAHLGPTREKEYLTPEAPAGIKPPHYP